MATSAESVRPSTADSLSQPLPSDRLLSTGSKQLQASKKSVSGWCLIDRYGRKHAIQSNNLILGRENCDILLKVFIFSNI